MDQCVTRHYIGCWKTEHSSALETKGEQILSLGPPILILLSDAFHLSNCGVISCQLISSKVRKLTSLPLHASHQSLIVTMSRILRWAENFPKLLPNIPELKIIKKQELPLRQTFRSRFWLKCLPRFTVVTEICSVDCLECKVVCSSTTKKRHTVVICLALSVTTSGYLKPIALKMRTLKTIFSALVEGSMSGVPNLSLNMHPFNFSTDEHAPLKVKQDEASVSPHQTEHVWYSFDRLFPNYFIMIDKYSAISI